MSEFLQALNILIETADSTEQADNLQPLLHPLRKLIGRASPAELDSAVLQLSAALDLEYAQAYGWLALAGGAMVEAGASPSALTARLLKLLPELLQRAWKFAQNALGSTHSRKRSEQLSAAETDGGLWLGDRLLPASRLDAFHESDPNGLDAWLALDHWCRPAIASLSRDPDARRQFNWAGLQALAELSNDVHNLWRLMSVSDHAPFLVLHPASHHGFRLRISGVADNFQLHTLLADALIPPLPGTRPGAAAVAVARGEGRQEHRSSCNGVWDLYQWTALNAKGRLPAKVLSRHWIWGEGTPVDIQTFEQYQIILLAEPSYSRGWSNSRFFDGLKASVTMEEVLAPDVAGDWLRRLGEAAAAQPPAAEIRAPGTAEPGRTRD